MASNAMTVHIVDRSGEFKDGMEQACLLALEKCGLIAEGYAARLCPVDTGRLRNSIKHTVKESEPAAYIGSDVSYAAYVELGTSRQKAQPYLKPAVADHANEYREIIETELKSS